MREHSYDRIARRNRRKRDRDGNLVESQNIAKRRYDIDGESNNRQRIEKLRGYRRRSFGSRFQGYLPGKCRAISPQRGSCNGPSSVSALSSSRAGARETAARAESLRRTSLITD